MTLDIQSFMRPQWEPLPREGCRNVEGRVLMHEGGLAIALLRFGRDATIDEHAGTSHTQVFCLEGEGFVYLGGESSRIASGERVTWPPGIEHRLWTEDSEMMTLMVERDSL